MSEDVPVAAPTAVARALGIEPAPEPARFISEITRFANNIGTEKRTLAAALALSGSPPADSTGPAPEPPQLVPVPLTTAVWADAVFRRRMQPSEIVSAILADRNAALLCHGLAGADDETLEYLIDHPAVISYLYRNAAASFAAFATSLHIHAGRVVTPGGAAGVRLWESAVGEQVSRPDRFARQLFSRNEGRIAYLYDGISGLDPARAAFALGLWMSNPSTRERRFNAMIALTSHAYREWKIKVLPFSRPVHDVISLLMRVQVAPDGSPRAPASRALWSRVLESEEVPAVGARLPADPNDGPVDAAWLVNVLLTGEVHDRGDRLDQFSFGQRAFESARDADRRDLFAALRAFGRYRMLVLTLDRLGITKPGIYAAVARHAARLSALDRRHGPLPLAEFQSALALVAHMRLVQSLDSSQAEALIVSLAAVPLAEDGYRGALLEWVDRELRPLTKAADVESGVIAELSAIGVNTAPVQLDWEGDAYHLDLAAAEDRRLHQIREKQKGLPLDLALRLASVARRLSAQAPIPADRTEAAATLSAAVATLTFWSKTNFGVSNAGADPSPQWRTAIEKVIEDLARAEAAADARRMARIVEPLIPVADAIGADALLSLAYAVDLGDPEGTVLNAGNVALRHDFGIGIDDGATRVRTEWAVPRQDVAPGVPWHVIGSALGLDVALAPLGLRRVDTTRMTEAPRLTLNERQTFALSVALMNPFTMTDADRDLVAAAIDRGDERVRTLTPASLDDVVRDVAMDGWRRRAAEWGLEHDPANVPSLFSLTELLRLGGANPSPALDGWGMAAFVSTGCVCNRLTAPGEWRNLAGRPQLGLLATAVADVQLRVASTLRDLGLPAAIAKHVLSGAVQDYIDEVRPNDIDDWLTLVRTARKISRDRIEDYVAAVTADGPLIPDAPSGSPNR